MTHEEHKARHKALHEEFGELVADYFGHYPAALPQDTTVGQLLTWSTSQANNPTEGRETVHVITVCAHCGEYVKDPETHMCAAEMMEHDR